MPTGKDAFNAQGLMRATRRAATRKRGSLPLGKRPEEAHREQQEDTSLGRAGRAMIMVTGMLVAAQLAQAPPAAAVASLDLFVSNIEGPDSSSFKLARAICPEGEQVVGGGAWADDFGAGAVMLTQLQPHDGVPGVTSDTYVAIAHEPATGFAGSWALTAYALCAAASQDYQIVPGAVEASPAETFKTTAAVCPNGKRVVGTGAEISNIAEPGQVGLQLSRASGPLDIARATAREDANGYNGTWTLRSWAVCRATVLANVTAEGTGTSSAGGLYTCSNSQHEVHSVGGGGSLTNIAGPVFLQALHPFDDLRTVRLQMTGPPVSGGLAIQAICGQ